MSGVSPANVIGNGDIQSNDIIVALVQRELISSTILTPTVRNVSQYATKGNSSISFPRAGSMNVQKKVSGVPINPQALVYGADKLELDQHAVVQWLIEDRAGMQSVVDMELDIIQRATRAHGYQIDLDTYAKLRLVTGSHVINYTGGVMGSETIAKADLLEAQRLLELQGLSGEQFYIACNPLQKKQFLLIDDFVSADKYGATNAIQKGELGMLYGMKVLSTPAVTANETVVYHMDHVAFGLQIAPEYRNSYDMDHVGFRHQLQQLYGMKDCNEGKMAVRIVKP